MITKLSLWLRRGFAVLALCTCVSIAAEPPNIVIIIGDDVGWDDIGTYGNPHVRTPNIDALARAGLQFNNAFLTTSSCSPSRASIMTGRYPHATRAAELHQPLSEDTVTIPAKLKAAGYYTASIGKFHMGHIQSHFDRVESSNPSGCEKWVEAIQNRPKDKPFFFWLAGIDAHRDWSATTGEHAIAQPHSNEVVVVPPYLPDTPEVRRDLAEYYDEVSRLDDYTGKVIAELESQGVLDNTIIIFMSDNGRPFPRSKTTLYDDGLKTPLILMWKDRVQPGTVTQSLISAVDIAPSILELAGLDSPSTHQGKSFVPILSDTSAEIRDYVFAEHNWHDYQAHERSVRSKQYLYMRNAFPQFAATPPADAVRSPTYQQMRQLRDTGDLTEVQGQIFQAPRDEEMLFDLHADPYAFRNLVHAPEHSDVLTGMIEQHRRWSQDTKDEIPTNPTSDRFDRETGERLDK